ncbi:MAG: lipoate--protein ligase family protein [Candidatus Margulisiibacteriota bacterium]
MATDLSLFKQFEEQAGGPTLRIYSWRPKCVSAGYSQSIEEEIDLKKAELLGWDIVKRPTGGGIVFHNEAETTYSLVMAKDDPMLPKGLVPSYKKISEAVVFALLLLGVKAEVAQSSPRLAGARHPSPSPMERGMNFDDSRKKGVRSLCFSYPAEYEIVVDGRKIVGSAQKRGKVALLQQGSIFVCPTPSSAFELLKKSHDLLNAISLEELLGRTPSVEELSTALVKGFQEVFGITFHEV